MHARTRTHVLLLTYSCSLALRDCMCSHVDTINAAYHVRKPCKWWGFPLIYKCLSKHIWRINTRKKSCCRYWVAEHSYVNYGKSTFQLVDILGNDELSRPLFGRFVRASEARKLEQRGVHTRVLIATILPVSRPVTASLSSYSSMTVILKYQIGWFSYYIVLRNYLCAIDSLVKV